MTFLQLPWHDSALSSVIRSLKGKEAQALVERCQVGRLAYSFHDRVDVEPIHYVYSAPCIFGRTSASAKLLTLAHNQWCAFEVDEVSALSTGQALW